MNRFFLVLAMTLFCAAGAFALSISNAPDAGTLTGGERIPVGRGNNQALSTTVNQILAGYKNYSTNHAGAGGGGSIASTNLTDFSSTPPSSSGKIPIYDQAQSKYVPGDPLVQGLYAADSATQANPVLIGVWDGTNLRAILGDSSGRMAVNVNGTVPVSGTFWQATQPVSMTSLPAGGVANDTTAIGNGLEVQGAVSRATPTATTAGRSEKLQVSTTNGGVFANIVGGAGVLPASVQPANAATALNALEVLPGIVRSAVQAGTAGRSTAASIDATNGSLNVRITDASTYLAPAVLANDTTAIANGLSVHPGVARATPTAVTAGRAEMEQMDAATGGQYVAPVATTTATGLSAVGSATVTTAVVLKASPGNVYGFSAVNGAASVCWVQFLNASSSPTLGTNIVFAIALPASGVVNFTAGDLPLSNFSTGISMGIAAGATGSTVCGTAGNITTFYK